MRRRRVLLAGLALAGLLTLAVLTLAAPAGPDLRARGAPLLATLNGLVTAFLPEAPAAVPEPKATARVAVEDGRTIVRLTPEERDRVGLRTAILPARPHRQELTAYGSVLDLARVTELTNAYAGAVAGLQTARARAEVSASAARRARSLGPATMAAAQIETVEATVLTDQAAVTAAESQLRTLAATAQQEWGPVLGRAIVERGPLVTRLIERADFLMQVTLPPGEILNPPPDAAFAEVPPQSDRVPLRLVSPATRTDPRIQGQSFFYRVSGRPPARHEHDGVPTGRPLGHRGAGPGGCRGARGGGDLGLPGDAGRLCPPPGPGRRAALGRRLRGRGPARRHRDHAEGRPGPALRGDEGPDPGLRRRR